MKVVSKHTIKDELAACVRWLEILPIKESGVDDIARLLGKSRRTIEAYLAHSNDRVISADDLMIVGIEVARRVGKFPKSPRMCWAVLDDIGEVTETVNDIVTASFLADFQGGSYHLDHNSWSHKPKQQRVDQLKSQLRRMLYSGAVTKEQACDVLNCDEYMLVMYQSIFPFSSCQVPAEKDVDELCDLARLPQSEFPFAA